MVSAQTSLRLLLPHATSPLAKPLVQQVGEAISYGFSKPHPITEEMCQAAVKALDLANSVNLQDMTNFSKCMKILDKAGWQTLPHCEVFDEEEIDMLEVPDSYEGLTSFNRR
jgi:hypothetical protein